MTKFTGTNAANTANWPTTLIGFKPNNILAFIDGNGDKFLALGGDDFVSAGGGNDNINGGTGNDILFGNDGDDILNGGGTTPNRFGYGFDFLFGGNGADTYNVTAAFSRTTVVIYSLDLGPIGVNINLATGTGTDTFGKAETLHGVHFVVATNDDDTLTGSNGDDTLAPGRGTDIVDGGDGTDTLAYYAIQSKPDDSGTKTDGFGYTAGITVVHTGDNAGTVAGTDGIDTTFTNMEIIAGTRFADTITGSSADDWLIGGEGDDILNGGTGGTHDIVDYSLDVVGGGQNGVNVNLLTSTATDGFGNTDTLTGMDDVIGTRFADTITGDANANTLTGGLGKDTLTGGGGGDIFDFNLKTDSVNGANRDVITDFSGVNDGGTDQINLHDVDAKKGGGNQDFKWIGTAKFHHQAGELHFKAAGVGVYLVEGDIDGNGKADFQIEVHSAALLNKLDFVL